MVEKIKGDMVFENFDVTYDEALEIAREVLFYLADYLKETEPYATNSIKVYEDAAHRIPVDMETLNKE